MASSAGLTGTGTHLGIRAHHRFWPARLPHAINLPATSLWDNLETSARRYPDKAALVFFGQVISYADLLEKAQTLAGFHLTKLNVWLPYRWKWPRPVCRV